MKKIGKKLIKKLHQSLMNKSMKINSFLLVSIIITFLLSGGCIKKETFDLKMTIEPLVNNSVTSDKLASAADIIKNRLINLGITSEKINIGISEDKINLTISKIDTGKITIIEKLVTVQGKIGFWETYENSELIEYLSYANKLLFEMQVNKEDEVIAEPAEEMAVNDTAKTGENLLDQLYEDSLSVAEDSSRKEFLRQNPLFGILFPRIDNEGKPIPSCMIGISAIKDTARVNSYFKMKEVAALFPRNIRFYWSYNPYPWDDSKSFFELHAIKVNNITGDAPVGRNEIVEAKATTNKSRSNIRLSLSMNAEGAKIFARMTRQNIDRCIAVLLDGYVRSYPRVMNEIDGGKIEITGDFSMDEAQYLAGILSSGENGLPFKLNITGKQIIKE